MLIWKTQEWNALLQHKLIDLITIAICAVICGAENWVAIETYGEAKLQWLQQFLELPNGIPSHIPVKESDEEEVQQAIKRLSETVEAAL